MNLDLTWRELFSILLEDNTVDLDSRVVVHDLNSGEEAMCDLLWVDEEQGGVKYARPIIAFNLEELDDGI